jgi:hypothetical protein
MAESRAKSAMSGSRRSGGKKSGKKPHEIRIRKGKSGGHIVTHHYQPDETGTAPEPEEHVMPDQASLLSHIAANTDSQPAPQATPAPDASAQAGPPAGAPPAAAPQPGA